MCSFKCHEKDGGAASVAHCSASNTLVTGANKGGVINVFSLNTMQLVKRLEIGKSSRIHRLTYDPLADMLLAGTADGALRVRDDSAMVLHIGMWQVCASWDVLLFTCAYMYIFMC